ncbi:AAA family ATPase [Actinoplanes awajinensis]|uniref:Kinase n=1 Tax=Actinoplanes awajinensis subsp. mycoplanecinus TaxID=135947 RepID=A0A124G7M8_9ACTN|nr:ATP-binding protein [Actinoplanes awajinensis]KUL23157.1 hypothetical protein ADL15_46705 [Actinoplanes awajinensis subsp. mycoplanecinus]
MGVVYLLSGLTGSGKTTYARKLVEEGVVRLSVDEMMHSRHGRFGIDYRESRYFELEAPIIDEIRGRLVRLIGRGRDVVFDHGLWRRADRDTYKHLVEAHGAQWRLLYFKVDKAELQRRLAERHQRDGANAATVSPRALDEFYARFDEPMDEGEEIITGTGLS